MLHGLTNATGYLTFAGSEPGGYARMNLRLSPTAYGA